MKRTNNRRTGAGEISGTYLTYLRRKAKDRGLIWGVSPEYLWKIFLKQNRKCALSGVELIFSMKIDKNNNVDRTNHTASLDRIDNNLPYIEGNVQWTHKIVNVMRRQFSVDEYIYWCSLVFKHANLELSQTNDINCSLESATTNGRGLSSNKSDTSARQPVNQVDDIV